MPHQIMKRTFDSASISESYSQVSPGFKHIKNKIRAYGFNRSPPLWLFILLGEWQKIHFADEHISSISQQK